MAKKKTVRIEDVLKKITKAIKSTKKDMKALLPSEKAMMARLNKALKSQKNFEKMLDDAMVPEGLRNILVKVIGNKELSKDLKELFRESLKFQLAEAHKFLDS